MDTSAREQMTVDIIGTPLYKPGCGLLLATGYLIASG